MAETTRRWRRGDVRAARRGRARVSSLHRDVVDITIAINHGGRCVTHRRTCATQPAPTVAPRTVSPPGNASASVRRASRRVCVARVARFCRSPQRRHLCFRCYDGVLCSFRLLPPPTPSTRSPRHALLNHRVGLHAIEATMIRRRWYAPSLGKDVGPRRRPLRELDRRRAAALDRVEDVAPPPFP